jgi:ABC-type antimicrobial peptide transport system permease subunit
MAHPLWRVVGLSVIARNVLGEAIASLRMRRMQAALSSFGIATGIAAVVLLVSIVSGMHHFAIEQMGAIGGNQIQVMTSPQRSTRDPRGFQVTLRTDDLAAVLESVSEYDIGMAENSGFGVVRTAKRSTREVSVRGVTTQAFELMGLTTDRGRSFLPTEYTTGSRVAVLGADVAMDLFASTSPVGETVVIGDWPFLIVGVLNWVGDPAAGASTSFDRSIYVPFKACAAAFRGNENAGSLRLRLKSADTAAAAMAATKAVLEPRRKQRGETSGEYVVISSIERLGQLNLVLTTIKLVVGLVGGIGLFVGAVGVANVLFVSVRERRAEIGTRRAVGATRRAIFAGFLIEALVMTLSGGIVGILIAWGLTKIAIFIPSVPVGARPIISLTTALTAIGLLTLVGLIAGVWPARRAAAVFPAEALRAD